jgi:phosphate starvation-inducible membrane PsiE
MHTNTSEFITLIFTSFCTNFHLNSLVQTELKLNGPQSALNIVEKSLEILPVSSVLWNLSFILRLFLVFQRTIASLSTATTPESDTSHSDFDTLSQSFSMFFERVKKSGVLLVDLV